MKKTLILSIALLASFGGVKAMDNKVRRNRCTIGSRKQRLFCKRNKFCGSQRLRNRSGNCTTNCRTTTCSINNTPLHNNPQQKPNTQNNNTDKFKTQEDADIRRAIKLSLQDKQETIQECMVCLENKTIQHFSTLSCGHALCTTCKDEIKNQQCPYCRKPF